MQDGCYKVFVKHTFFLTATIAVLSKNRKRLVYSFINEFVLIAYFSESHNNIKWISMVFLNITSKTRYCGFINIQCHHFSWISLKSQFQGYVNQLNNDIHYYYYSTNKDETTVFM